MKPLFSIIIPTFNRAHCIKNAIESVMTQGFESIEIIVVDDGSTDNTENILHEYGNRIRYQKQSNQGVCSARNAGARSALGYYLIFLDSDDQLLPASLPVYATVLNKSKGRLLLSTIVYVSQTGEQKKRIDPWAKGKNFTHPLTGSFVIQRELFEQLGGYDEKLTFSETSDFFVRASQSTILNDGDISIVKDAGVAIIETDIHERKQRYSLRKYESVKYFLEKHREFFLDNPYHYINFKRIHAMTSLQNGHYQEAQMCFWEVLKVKPTLLKSYTHFFSSLMFPKLMRLYYNR